MTGDGDGLDILMFLLLGFFVAWVIISAIAGALKQDAQVIGAAKALSEKTCPPHAWSERVWPSLAIPSPEELDDKDVKKILYCPVCKKTPAMVSSSIDYNKPY